MADLSELAASQSVKLAGAGPSSGIETNWAQVSSTGSLQVAGEGTAGVPAGGVLSAQIPDITTSGSITANGQTITINNNGVGSCSIIVGGTWVGSLAVKGSTDGITFVTLLTATGATGLYSTTAITTNGHYRVYRTSSFKQLEITSTAWTSGTANIVINASQAVDLIETIQTNSANLQTAIYANNSGSQIQLAADSAGAIKISSLVSLSNFFYDDMNVANGGIARGTNLVLSTLTTLYSHTGAGTLYGFILNVGGLGGATTFAIDLVVDGNHIFGASGISTGDLLSSSIYDIGQVAADTQGFLGWAFTDKSLRWQAPGGAQVQFTSSMQIKITQTAGGSQKFNAGLVALIR